MIDSLLFLCNIMENSDLLLIKKLFKRSHYKNSNILGVEVMNNNYPMHYEIQ